MNIFINGRFLSRRMTGVDRFALELLKGVARLQRSGYEPLRNMNLEVVSTNQANIPPELEVWRHTRLSGGAGIFWEQVCLGYYSLMKQGLLINLCNTGPMVSGRAAVVVHDAATVSVPLAFSKSFRYWYNFLIPIICRASRLVGTVSDFSKDEIIKHYGVPTEKIVVLREGCEHIVESPADPSILEKWELQKRPYVLAVSSMAAHKNFKVVLDSVDLFPNSPFDIVIAGGANQKVFGSAAQMSNPNVKWVGYVRDAELRALYEGAMCFVFPSVYEGFGIPPLEAMYCGCPVVASSAASIPGVCGDAALYFDPNDAVSLGRTLNLLSTDSQLRASLRERGLSRSRQFTWDRAAREFVDFIRKSATEVGVVA